MLRGGSHVGLHFAYHWLPWKLLDSVSKVEREREREKEEEETELCLVVMNPCDVQDWLGIKKMNDL